MEVTHLGWTGTLTRNTKNILWQNMKKKERLIGEFQVISLFPEYLLCSDELEPLTEEQRKALLDIGEDEDALAKKKEIELLRKRRNRSPACSCVKKESCSTDSCPCHQAQLYCIYQCKCTFCANPHNPLPQ